MECQVKRFGDIPALEVPYRTLEELAKAGQDFIVENFFEKSGQWGSYMVVECREAEGNGQFRFSTSRRRILQKLQYAAESNLLPLLARVVKLPNGDYDLQ